MGVKLMAVNFATLISAIRVSVSLVLESNPNPIAETKACQVLAKTIALHAVLVRTLIDQIAAVVGETVSF